MYNNILEERYINPDDKSYPKDRVVSLLESEIADAQSNEPDNKLKVKVLRKYVHIVNMHFEALELKQ